MPARTSYEKGVRLSVRLSVKHVDCDKTEERSVQIFTPHEISLSLVFWQEKLLVEGDPFYLVKLTPLERNRQLSVDIHS